MLDLTAVAGDAPPMDPAAPKAEMMARFAVAEAWVPGRRIRVLFGGAEGAMLLDGVGLTVGEGEGAADATLRVSWADWLALGEGRLSPMLALLTGRMKIEGDPFVAMQLPKALAKVAR